MTIDLANVRFRAERNMDLCLHEHNVHQDGGELWITCDTEEIARTTLPFVTTLDNVEHFVHCAINAHERKVAATVVCFLLEVIDRQNALLEPSGP